MSNSPFPTPEVRSPYTFAANTQYTGEYALAPANPRRRKFKYNEQGVLIPNRPTRTKKKV